MRVKCQLEYGDQHLSTSECIKELADSCGANNDANDKFEVIELK